LAAPLSYQENDDMIEATEKEIGGVVYRTTKIPAMRATKLQNRLARVLGPGLAQIAGALLSGMPSGSLRLENLDLSRVDYEMVGGAVAGVFSELDDATTEALIRELLSTTCYVDDRGNPRPIFPTSGTKEFDAHFADALPRIWQVVGWNVGVNYGGFFSAVSDLIRRGQALEEARRAKAPSASLETDGT
jgi:hypothetical protein